MSDYDDYLNKYSNKHKITIEESKEHMIVKEVKKMYDEADFAKKTNSMVGKEDTL